jgi:hypothetical protein
MTDPRGEAVSDEPYLSLEAGADIAGAIQWLISLADPTARARCTTPTYEPLLAELHYAEDTDWLAAADELAESIGLKLHKIADVWVLAPRTPVVHVHLELDGKEIRRVVNAEIDRVMDGLVASIGKVSG